MTFVLWATLMIFLFGFVFLRPALDALQAATLRLVFSGASLAGLEPLQWPGNILSFGPSMFSYEISTGCTAWAVLLLYGAAVLAYPTRWRARGVGLVVGLPLVFALNVTRLVSMAWLGVYHPSMFEEAHGFWWQLFVILAVGIGWLLWVRHVADPAPGETRRGELRGLGACVVLFLAAAFLVEFVGMASGFAEAYGEAVIAVASWMSRETVTPMGTPEAGAFFLSFYFGALAAVLALYAATPRVPVRVRIRDALRWGLPSQFAFQTLTLAIEATVPPTRSPVLYSLRTALGMVGGVAVWYAWARSRAQLATRAKRAEGKPGTQPFANDEYGPHSTSARIAAHVEPSDLAGLISWMEKTS